MSASKTTKKCARKECENRIELQGRHCSRGRGAFLRDPQLCRECVEVWCRRCFGKGCKSCDKTGKLTERQLAQRAVLKRRDAHAKRCETCRRDPPIVAYEEYDVFHGKRRHGTGSRSVYGTKLWCLEGREIITELKALGAVLDKNGWQSGWDGRDWSGEPLEELKPGYREVVTWRREVDQAERDQQAKEDENERA